MVRTVQTSIRKTWKIIKQTSRKNNAEIIDKSSKKASKMELKSTKNQWTMRAKKKDFSKVPVGTFSFRRETLINYR